MNSIYKKKYLKYKNKYLSLKQNLFGGENNNVEDSWNLIINTVSKLKLNENFNGLHYWNTIKPFLKSIDKKTPQQDINWQASHTKMTENFSGILTEIPEHDENNNIIEVNHFLLQQLNIPNKDGGNPSFRRLMQLALNIGQLNATKHNLSDEINKLITTNNLSNIETYMNKENYSKYNYTQEDHKKLVELIQSYEQ